MTYIALKDLLLKIINKYGPLAFPELLILVRRDENLLLTFNLKLLTSNKEELSKYIEKTLQSLIKEKKIIKYNCNSGYRIRYSKNNILALSSPLNLKLNLCLKKCKECSSWIVRYNNNKFKHISSFYCENRLSNDDSDIHFLEFRNKKFILYKHFFLGVFEKGFIRFPYIDYKYYQPEFIIALDKYQNMKINTHYKKHLKLKFKEILI